MECVQLPLASHVLLLLFFFYFFVDSFSFSNPDKLQQRIEAKKEIMMASSASGSGLLAGIRFVKNANAAVAAKALAPDQLRAAAMHEGALSDNNNDDYNGEKAEEDERRRGKMEGDGDQKERRRRRRRRRRSRTSKRENGQKEKRRKKKKKKKKKKKSSKSEEDGGESSSDLSDLSDSSNSSAGDVRGKERMQWMQSSENVQDSVRRKRPRADPAVQQQARGVARRHLHSDSRFSESARQRCTGRGEALSYDALSGIWSAVFVGRERPEACWQ